MPIAPIEDHVVDPGDEDQQQEHLEPERAWTPASTPSTTATVTQTVASAIRVTRTRRGPPTSVRVTSRPAMPTLVEPSRVSPGSASRNGHQEDDPRAHPVGRAERAPARRRADRRPIASRARGGATGIRRRWARRPSSQKPRRRVVGRPRVVESCPHLVIRSRGERRWASRARSRSSGSIGTPPICTRRSTAGFRLVVEGGLAGADSRYGWSSFRTRGEDRRGVELVGASRPASARRSRRPWVAELAHPRRQRARRASS